MCMQSRDHFSLNINYIHAKVVLKADANISNKFAKLTLEKYPQYPHEDTNHLCHVYSSWHHGYSLIFVTVNVKK